PAASLKLTNLLPVGQVQRWLSNSLIRMTLWSISRVFLRDKWDFLPALRETAGRRSVEPGAIAVDVVGSAGKTGAMAADHRHQRLVEGGVVGVDGVEPLAGCGDAIAQPVEIDRRHPPVVDDEAAADHHARHRGAVLGMDELV